MNSLVYFSVFPQWIFSTFTLRLVKIIAAGNAMQVRTIYSSGSQFMVGVLNLYKLPSILVKHATQTNCY